jgi:hypothetical protein
MVLYCILKSSYKNMQQFGKNLTTKLQLLLDTSKDQEIATKRSITQCKCPLT